MPERRDLAASRTVDLASARADAVNHRGDRAEDTRARVDEMQFYVLHVQYPFDHMSDVMKGLSQANHAAYVRNTANRIM